MIAIAFPGFLLAGVLFATIPIALHLLSRRPPAREPLPTARFLARDAHTLLRWRRRPTDLPHLMVRLLFAVALAAAFAGLTWTGQRTGAARVILLDAGADSMSDWDVRREEARRLASQADDGPQAVIVAYGLPDDHRIVSPSELAGLQRGDQPATAQAGLRALRSTISQGRWKSAHAVWLTRPSWRLWSPDTGLLRAEIWPGRTPLVQTLTISPRTEATPAASTSAWVFEGATGDPLHRALEALGVRAVDGETGDSAGPDWIYAESPPTSALEDLLARAERGATLVLSGRIAGGRPEIPWSPTAPSGSRPSGLILAGHSAVIGTAVPRQAGAPGSDASVLAVFDDATPAAASQALGSGCVVYVAASMLDPALTGSPGYPTLVQALPEGCARLEAADGPLDPGALFALERPDLPAAVDAAVLGTVGYPLTLWLLLLALVCLLLEVGLTRGGRA